MLVDDQIEEKEASGALDELSRRINRKPSKDVIAGINALVKFQGDLKMALTKEMPEPTDLKDNKNINQANLVKDIRSDMGER